MSSSAISSSTSSSQASSPLDRILADRLIAVLRLDLPLEGTLAVAEAIAAEGIAPIEVTFTTPGAIEAISRLAGRSDVLVGAGTVLDERQAREAIDAGARFLASPITDPAIIAIARSAGVVAMPGAVTPTEIVAAWRAGADLVKLFPMPSDGLKYLAALRGPLPEIRMAPSGGVSPETAGPFLRAGAAALNVGTWLTHEKDGSVGAPEQIAARARGLVRAVRDVR